MIFPFVILHLRDRLVAMPFKGKTPEEEAMRKRMVVRMVLTARALGEFDALAMVSEAWISRDRDYAKDGKMPRHDPKKIDAVMWTVRSNTESFLEAYEIAQHGKKRKLGDRLEFIDIYKHPDAKFSSWYDAGFDDHPPFSTEMLEEMRFAFNLLLPMFEPFGGSQNERN